MRDCTKPENYHDLVESARHCAGDGNCQECEYDTTLNCMRHLISDAADVIEGLQAEVERLKEGNEELREKQTYADHNGGKWRTGGKDILQAAYDHGYMDGWDKAKMEVQG